ncbi:hypothetical protein HK100_007474 [Physocladia obscura]|uniref:Wax synthase domain-containing protein n=1 Tax=Physocladia obscura TaxID=109957 RepID=A0AAD5X6W6_9FUNG|nr:hypothetical protein HK100_007474 [Physocladia obscura]
MHVQFVHLPVWVAALFVYIVAPLSLFFMLTATKLSNSSILAFFLPSVLGFALLVYTDDPVFDAFYKGALTTILSFCALDAAFIDRVDTKKWKLPGFIKFVLTVGRNPPHLAAGANQQNKNWKSKSALVSQKSMEILFGYVAYVCAKCYLDKYPPSTDVFILFPFDSVGLFKQLVFAILLFSLVGFVSTGYTAFIAILTETSFSPYFSSPHLSITLGEFWSKRWNRRIQPVLRKFVFCPVVRRFSKTDDPNAKPSGQTLAIATMVTFLFSGLFHEIVVAACMKGVYLGRNMAFFILSGVLTLLQTHLYRNSGFGKTWGKGMIWKLGSWFYTKIKIYFPVSPPPSNVHDSLDDEPTVHRASIDFIDKKQKKSRNKEEISEMGPANTAPVPAPELVWAPLEGWEAKRATELASDRLPSGGSGWSRVRRERRERVAAGGRDGRAATATAMALGLAAALDAVWLAGVAVLERAGAVDVDDAATLVCVADVALTLAACAVAFVALHRNRPRWLTACAAFAVVRSAATVLLAVATAFPLAAPSLSVPCVWDCAHSNSADSASPLDSDAVRLFAAIIVDPLVSAFIVHAIIDVRDFLLANSHIDQAAALYLV